MYCENCGNKLDDKSSFCGNCGFAVQIQEVKIPDVKICETESIDDESGQTSESVCGASTNRSSTAKWWVVLVLVLVISVGVFIWYRMSGSLFTYKEPEINVSVEENNIIDTNTSNNTSPEYFESHLICTASSEKGYNQWGENFTSMSAVDGNLETAWYEGTADYGIGEWLRVDFTKQTISGISLINGQALSKNNYYRYYANARVKKVLVEAEEFSKEFSLKDGITTFQDLKFNEKVETSYVKVTILDIYPGDNDKMTGISEIKLLYS